MTVEKEGYLGRIVSLRSDHSNIKSGSIGLCTADLDDVFAVWFEKPVSYTDDGKPIFWVSFYDKRARNWFKIIG